MDPLVWLPFEPSRLGEVPAGLRYEVVDPTRDVPSSVEDVAFYVAPYHMGSAVADVLPRMRSLQVVQTMSAGVDNIRPVIPPGVTLCNGRGIHNTSTAELALALILAAQRELPRFVRQQDRGQWLGGQTEALADKRVLIVGYGAIGAAIEARLLPFECEIRRVARSARDGVHAIDDLPELLPEADIVVLIVPLTDQTRGLVDAQFLGRMKAGALLVNLARGAVVDTAALVEALRAERVRAALDVVDPEPLPADHALWTAPGVLISPHVGGATTAMWPRAYRLIREQLERFTAGKSLVNVMEGEY